MVWRGGGLAASTLAGLIVGVWLFDALPSGDAPLVRPRDVTPAAQGGDARGQPRRAARADGDTLSEPPRRQGGGVEPRARPSPRHSSVAQSPDDIAAAITAAVTAAPDQTGRGGGVGAASADDALSRLLRRVQDNGLVVATTTDHGYLDLTVNWVCHLKALGLEKKVVVFALDEVIHNEMLARGVPSHFEKAMAKSADTVGHWNSKSYNQVVHTKTKHQVAVLERGYDLLFADVDIPWTADMRPQVLAEAAGVDFLGQQNWPQNDMNTGFMLVRSNPRTLHFFRTVLALEGRLESGEIRTGYDPRHDIFNPSDDQSAIAFTLLCGEPTGRYPGRGDDGFPKGGMVPKGSNVVVQPKWQKSQLHRRHALRPGQVMTTEHRRLFQAGCRTSGVNLTYALLPPMLYQTGHKLFAGMGFDAALTGNRSSLYHPNFMKGGRAKVAALQRYGRWALKQGGPPLECAAAAT